MMTQGFCEEMLMKVSEGVTAGWALCALHLSAIVLVGFILPASLVNWVVQQPYMDEVFHIPQAQQYCRGDVLTWDPTITTFPGLYMVSLMYASVSLPVARWTRLAATLPALCSPPFLRSGNILLGLVCCVLFYKIIRQLKPGTSSTTRACAKALVMALYPVHWFFMFLYYTDVGSTTAVMAMYLACLRRAYWVSALLGAISIMFRQSNVVWTLFTACLGVLDFLESLKPPAGGKDDLGGQVIKGRIGHAGLRRRSVLSKDGFLPVPTTPQASVIHDFSELLMEAWCVVRLAWRNRSGLLFNFSPFAVVISAFMAFVLYNGSIVVGAKEDHQVSPHFPQLLYFALVTAAVLSPLYFNPAQLVREAKYFWTRRQRINTLVCCILACGTSLVFVHWFTYAHPYMLADNRHYTFYMWKNVFRSHWSAKYLLIPAYVLSWTSILYRLAANRSRPWILLFLVAVGGVLVPAPLIEPRYYTVPFYIVFLHSHVERSREGLATFLLGAGFLLTNVVTMYIFLFRPFEWAHESGVQRFMWYQPVFVPLTLLMHCLPNESVTWAI